MTIADFHAVLSGTDFFFIFVIAVVAVLVAHFIFKR